MPDLEDIPVVNRLGNKLGPLPAWVWVAIPAGVYVIYAWFKASRDNRTGAQQAATDAATDTYSDSYGINNGGSSLPGYGSAPSGTSNPPPIVTPKFTDADWAKQAITWMISTGASPFDATIAVNSYINGKPPVINSTQRRLLARAIENFGPAPSGGNVPGAPPQIGNPDPPTNIQVVLISPTTARVSWGPPQRTNGTLLGFKVEQMSNGKLVSTKLAVANQFRLDFNVRPARTYNFKVYARNNATNNGGYSMPANQSVIVP